MSDAKSALNQFSGVYAIVDSVVHASYGLERLLTQIVVESEIPVVQMRWKTLDGKNKTSLLDLAQRLKLQRKICVIVNDDSEYLDHPAVDGLHLGQKDIALEMVRKVHPEKIFGLSTHTLDQAIAGAKKADYIGCGAVYETTTKTSATLLGYEALCQIVKTVDVPTVAIGGIDLDNVEQIAGSGCGMAAVISALIQNNEFHGQKLHEHFMRHRRI